MVVTIQEDRLKVDTYRQECSSSLTLDVIFSFMNINHVMHLGFFNYFPGNKITMAVLYHINVMVFG